MQQQQPQVDRGMGMKDAMSIGMAIARALATSVEVFLHQGKSFGERYLGPQSVVAAAIMFCFPIFWPDRDPEPLLWFLATYLFLLLCAKGKVAKRRARGKPMEHSYYTGRPRLLRLTRGRGEVRIKTTLEPALVLITGMVATGINEPLGAYLMLAGVGLGLTVTASAHQDRMRALDMHDALLDQRRITELWRRGSGQ